MTLGQDKSERLSGREYWHQNEGFSILDEPLPDIMPLPKLSNHHNKNIWSTGSAANKLSDFSPEQKMPTRMPSDRQVLNKTNFFQGDSFRLDVQPADAMPHRQASVTQLSNPTIREHADGSPRKPVRQLTIGLSISELKRVHDDPPTDPTG